MKIKHSVFHSAKTDPRFGSVDIEGGELKVGDKVNIGNIKTATMRFYENGGTIRISDELKVFTVVSFKNGSACITPPILLDEVYFNSSSMAIKGDEVKVLTKEDL